VKRHYAPPAFSELSKIAFQKILYSFNYFQRHVRKMDVGMMLIINLYSIMRYALRLIDDLLTMHNTTK